MNIRVLIVDDCTLFRQALCVLLNSKPGLEVVGELSDGSKLSEVLDCQKVDVVLMDLAMPGVNGLEATKTLIKRNPLTRVLMLSASTSSLFISELFQAGAMGYVAKSSGSDELVKAIAAVFSGKRYCCPVANSAMDGRTRQSLSQRELNVLRLLATGKSSPQIARELNLAASTIDVHRRNIMGKLEVHSIAELTQYAIQIGMISA
jgi:DNA-binding NarL/FixJ family response regulator